jgi:diguanylate cyclase (GGDEF)-like protein
MAARWGGDEFLGILPVDVERAGQILNRFMEALNTDKKGSDGRVTVSVGIVEINEKSGVEQMIKKVDQALYSSKENGRNRITVGRAE